MNQSNFDDKGIQFAFDATTLESAQMCLRLYQYQFVEHWEPKYKSTDLIFGGHYAKGIERYHKFRAAGDSHNAAVEKVIDLALRDTWETRTMSDGRVIGVPWQSNHATKTRETLIRSLIWYLDEVIEHDPMKTVILSNGNAAVELSFKLVIDDDNLYCGHLDRVVDYGGQIMIADNKTTGSTVGPYYFKQYDLSFQMSGYAFAGKMIYQQPVKGIVIDAAQIAVGFSRFERGVTFRTDAQIEEWYSDMLSLINAIKNANRTGYYPRNTSSCTKYGGCAFADVCSRDPALRPIILKSEFVKRSFPWNPLVER